MDDSELVSFPLSHNLHRRHLTESQRAMIAANVANYRLGDTQHEVGAPIGAPSLATSTETRAKRSR